MRVTARNLSHENGRPTLAAMTAGWLSASHLAVHARSGVPRGARGVSSRRSSGDQLQACPDHDVCVRRIPVVRRRGDEDRPVAEKDSRRPGPREEEMEPGQWLELEERVVVMRGAAGPTAARLRSRFPPADEEAEPGVGTQGRGNPFGYECDPSRHAHRDPEAAVPAVDHGSCLSRDRGRYLARVGGIPGVLRTRDAPVKLPGRHLVGSPVGASGEQIERRPSSQVRAAAARHREHGTHATAEHRRAEGCSGRSHARHDSVVCAD